MNERRGRPRVVPGKRLEPICAGVDPDVYVYLKAVADRREVPIAAVVRSILKAARDFSFRNSASTIPPAH